MYLVSVVFLVKEYVQGRTATISIYAANNVLRVIPLYTLRDIL